MFRNTILVGLLLVGHAHSRAATITINDIYLVPDASQQMVTLNVSGGDAILDAHFMAQVGDGGPELVNFGLPPGNDAPGITSLDLESGIFLGNNQGQIDLIGSIPQMAAYRIFTNSGTVSASGTLVTLEFETLGFSPGQTFEFRITNTLAGNTTFYNGGEVPLTVNYTQGNHSLITIIPEPSNWVLSVVGLTIAVVFFAGWRFRGCSSRINSC